MNKIKNQIQCYRKEEILKLTVQLGNIPMNDSLLLLQREMTSLGQDEAAVIISFKRDLVILLVAVAVLVNLVRCEST